MAKIRAERTKKKPSDGSSTVLPESVKSTLKRKLETFKKKFPEKSEISIEELKKVYQKGFPKPTSRLNPIAIARVNKYLEKAGSSHIKKSSNKKFDDGGTTEKQIALPDAYSSPETLKRLLNQQGYDLIDNNQPIQPEDLKNDLTVSDIDNKYPNVSHAYINEQLMKGIKVEMEHTDNPEVARKIALDHLDENIQYYEYLNKMESEMASQSEIDQHFEEIYKKGGETDTKRIPSTDKSVWNAKYNVFDKVRIRIDMLDKSGSPTDIYTIESIILDGMMKRPENPSGTMYKLNLGGGTWEGKDLEYADESRNSVKPDLGFDPIFSFKTPTGERTRLNYIQQVLVRTSKFKAFFGDWEMAARSFIADGKNNFDRHFEDISKIVDSVTLEPRVVFHGTMSEKEFFNFDVTREKGIGRPYAYFAFNKEYSQNFTTGSQRGDNDGKAILYNVFLNVRHPFYALGPQFENVKEDAEHWIEVITDRIYYDKYKKTQKDEFHSALKSTIYGQVGRYVTKAFPNDIKEKFWRLMSYDADKEFKYFLIAYGYDGVIYDEEFTSQYDINDSGLYTKAVTVFDARQIKLADGRNTEFNPMLSDLRFDDGGKVTEGQSSEHITENHNTMNKKEQLEKLMFGGPTGIFKDGGKVKGDGNLDHDAKDGGFFVGQSHADGGIKAVNKDTGQIIEVEGNEVIINKRSVADTTKREFEGEMLTNREILSRINEAGGGVKFEDGGPLSCCGKKYKFGGETKEDFTIVYEISQTKDGHTLAHEYLKEFYK
jgi:hypothetical protein